MKARLLTLERPVQLRLEVDGIEGVWRLTLDDTRGAGFVSIYAPADWTATYWWGAWSRGDASLLAFLLRTDVSYVAIKFGVGNEFDGAATERAAKVELWRTHRREYRDLVDGVNFHTRDDYMDWLRYSAPGPEAWHRFPEHTRIRPDFARFHERAWPLLREKREEIEAALYPNGVPVKAVA